MATAWLTSLSSTTRIFNEEGSSAGSGSPWWTVDTHIKTLRAKLARVKPRLKPIRTHRGQGYSLQETS